MSVEGGYRETNIAPHTERHKGLCENIPKERDVGHVIYLASVLLCPQQGLGLKPALEEKRGAELACLRFSNKE